jgi:hypothetical protein
MPETAHGMEQEYKRAGAGKIRRGGGTGSRAPKHSPHSPHSPHMGYAGGMIDAGGDDYGGNRAGNADGRGPSSLTTGSYRAGSGGEALRFRSKGHKGNRSPSSKRAVAPAPHDELD